ncbi:MAG: hypothetical protein A2096_04065 [Spirochaetes bacterium GWF1_41_5]|nr:MAG: hypothetical protein A2096_04065 [Spirochaetes bacterium GWF1_41_5]
MRIIFRQCKYCPNNNDCSFRQQIKNQTAAIKNLTAVIRQCSCYKTLFSPGNRVLLLTHHQRKNLLPEAHGRKRFPQTLWTPGPAVTGTITGRIIRGFLWQIKLDLPLTLYRIKEINDVEPINMTYYYKPAAALQKISEIKYIESLSKIMLSANKNLEIN